jgi:adenosylhomocysteine nucleosidase
MEAELKETLKLFGATRVADEASAARAASATRANRAAPDDQGKRAAPDDQDKRESVSLRAVRGVWAASFERDSGDTEELVFAVTGVGKVLTAVSLQEVILEYAPRMVLFGGTAGAAAEGLEIGDLVVASETVQWDMDARAARLPRGTVPFLGKSVAGGAVDMIAGGRRTAAGSRDRSVISLDPDLRAAALKAAEGLAAVREGKVATGDTLVAGGLGASKREIREEFDADVVDMEGWAAAYTASLYGIPLLLLRVISDTAEEGRHGNIRKVIASSSRLLSRVFEGVLRDTVRYTAES